MIIDSGTGRSEKSERSFFQMEPGNYILSDNDRRILAGRSGIVLQSSIGNLELGAEIGHGAIGIVRKARIRSSDRVVAVKFLSPEPKLIDADAIPDIRERFAREGTRGSELDHEHLVKILGYEPNTDGVAFGGSLDKTVPFIVMEFVQGRTLENFIRMHQRGKHFTAEAISIALRIAQAVEYLHGRRVVHRDIKPANIFISKCNLGERPGTIKLGDFGVVKWGDLRAAFTGGTLTSTGQQGLGTFKYMSPEQALSPKSVGTKADIYSLGVTLFELFTGQILPSPHHVFQMTQARMMRTTIGGKLLSLGLNGMPHESDSLFEMILDMLLHGQDGRPAIRTVVAKLGYLHNQLADLR